MPRLEGMYAPGSQVCHVLPPAGFKYPVPSDVYRFNRVCPFYPPDPCIRPNEGDLVCPEEQQPCPVNHPWMPAAGTDLRNPTDTFRFQKVYPQLDVKPCKPAGAYPFASLGPATRDRPCPCTNRCPVVVHHKPYDLKLMYPKCVDRPPTPHFETPLFNNATPYVQWSSTSPYGPPECPPHCRVRFSKHLGVRCPDSDPTFGPNLAMFLECRRR